MNAQSSTNLNSTAAESLEALAPRLAGEILAAGVEYDAARRVHDITVDRHPSFILRASTSADVVEGVRYARRHNLELTVRAGGHGLSGHGVADGAMMLDLSRMKAISINPGTRTARVQPGVTSGDLAAPAHAYGLALTTGDTSGVGLGGLVTGGGIGWMVRKFGLTIDALRSVEVVTADGRLIRANARQHSDLFWAIRGGGGNFGIVTEFEFQMEQVGAVYGGVLVLPATPQVVRGYLDYAPIAPDELTTNAAIMAAPPAPFIPAERHGELSLIIYVCYTGDPADGERALEPLRRLAEPIADAVSQVPYPVMFAFTEPANAPGGDAIRMTYARALSDAAIAAMLEHGHRAPSPTSMIQLRGLGGAMARVPADATAFAHRDKPLMVTILGLWQDPSEDAAPYRAWTESLWSVIKREGEGAYVNFLANEGEARIREAYPFATYARLAEVKRRYDPENVFHFNQNVKPA